MDDRKKVRVKYLLDHKHFTYIEVYENDVEKVKEANRMMWREIASERRHREQLWKDGIIEYSYDAIDRDGSWISDNSPTPEEKCIKAGYEALKNKRK